MEQGESEAKIVEQARKLGMPLPDKMKNRPYLTPGLEFYWNAFSELSADRSVGMGEGPIPWSSMHQWALRHNIVGDEFERFIAVIRALDSAYMGKRNVQQKKALGKDSSKAPIKKSRNMRSG